MKRNRIIIMGVFLIFIVITVISFWISFFNDQKQRIKINDMEEEILAYLSDKYNETFDIVSYSMEINSYNVEKDDDYVTEYLSSSYIYTFNVTSSRLIEFDVIYVLYEDEKEYIDNKEYNIRNAGIYENYIYEYKMKEIKREMKDALYDIVSDYKAFDVSLENLVLGNTNILIDYSLDSEETKSLYNEYRNLDKSISNSDYFNFCLKIDSNVSIILNIDVNNYINGANVAGFQEETKELVNYLEENGYSNYDINYSFKNYQTARATSYHDDEIYLIFDYESYSNIPEDERVDVYILDK